MNTDVLAAGARGQRRTAAIPRKPVPRQLAALAPKRASNTNTVGGSGLRLGTLLAIAPAVAILLYMYVLPLLLLARNSLYPSTEPARMGDTLSLGNYVRLFGDSFYWGVIGETVTVGAAVVVVCVLLAYPLAYFLARTRSRWQGAITFLVLSPLLVSAIIRNLGWIPVLGRTGVVNQQLLGLGLIDAPLALIYNFSGVVIGLSHALLPFMVLMLLPVIRRIDIDLEEASSSLGASRLTTFLRVVLPLSRQGLLGGSLLVFCIAISGFTTVAMMGGRRVLLLATLVEQEVRSVLDYSFGAAVALVLMAISMAFTALAARWLGKSR